MTGQVAFWLLPAEGDRRLLEDIIDGLARQYAAPAFTPHVTLYSGEYADHEEPGAILGQAIAGMHALELTVDSIRDSGEFIKTLFIQFAPSGPLTALTERIRMLSETPSGYRFDPHLSLLYKHMPEADRRRAAGTVSLPRKQVAFDAVAGIVSHGHTSSPEDIERWKIQWHMTLPQQDGRAAKG